MIPAKYKEFFNRLFEPPAKLLIERGLSPNQITLAGLALGIVVCGIFIWTKNVLLFIVLIVFSGLFDLLDGVAARLSGKVTKFGGYLDAVCDRFFEGFVMLTVAYVTGYWVLIFLIVIGSITVSYAKARAAMEVPITNLEWPDFMERSERGIIFLAGLLISDVTHITVGDKDLFFWVLVALLIAIYGTVIQRVFRARQYIETRG